MKYLIISDIHSNLEALQVALDFVKYDRLIVLGDLVGYAASPNEVIELIISKQPYKVIRGNHDKVAAEVEAGDYFVSYALEAALWSRDQLRPENYRYLRELPQGPLEVDGQFTVAHGSPFDEEEYIFYEHDAAGNFPFFNTPICFFGHSHIPCIFILNDQQQVSFQIYTEAAEVQLQLPRGYRYLVNPGSIGQPRDGNPQGSCILYESNLDRIRYLRFNYSVGEAQRKILAAGLPPFLAERLALGR